MPRRTAKAASELLPSPDKLHPLLESRITDPHSALGMHHGKTGNSIIVRCLDPQADKVEILFDNGQRKEMRKIHPDGLFAIKFPKRKEMFAYRLEKHYGKNTYVSEDPYSFMPGIGEMDIYLFNKGEHNRVFEAMGAHPRKMGDVPGIRFTVWAPNADRVSVVGDFNMWDGRRHMMRMIGSSGIWELFIPRMESGEIYKFELRAKNGDVFLKLDPYAYRTELRPNNAAITTAGVQDFQWRDDDWIKARINTNWLKQPVNIYEVHLASWRGPGLREIDPDNENDFHTYRELAHALTGYVKEIGYTHVELMPVAEHPLDISWGYQVTGFYSPTARFGAPEDFAYFVDYLHQNGIGVILDWVPAHFPKDAFSLGRFDGTALYEHADPRQGEQRDWGTYIFNFGRNEVKNFLIGNALFWMERYHVDGLRVDAVASMLYLNYSRDDGEWLPNQYGGNENLEAIAFLRRLNELTNKLHPGTLMIAEESTAWPMVSHPTYLGGLGFNNKWNMGWMHDTLEYFTQDPVYRSYHHGQLTFSLVYAFSENFILPLSHDEVVYGKRSLLNKMPGDYDQKFANLRALLAFMTCHPGKKLLFMGGEFGQWNEWNSVTGLDWNLLDHPRHKEVREMVKAVNRMYRETPSLWQEDYSQNGFQWIESGDYQQSVYSFVRWDEHRKNPVVVIANLTPVDRNDYKIGVPEPGKWTEIFCSESKEFGGRGRGNPEPLDTVSGTFHNFPHHLPVFLPGLSVTVLKRG